FDDAAAAGRAAGQARSVVDEEKDADGGRGDKSQLIHMALLEIKNLTVRFGGLKALTDFNFSLDPGQLLGLIGPNGAGKTTAFNVVTGMYKPTSGTILFDGKEIGGRATFRINQ